MAKPQVNNEFVELVRRFRHIPFHALTDNCEVENASNRLLVEKADVIFGQDVDSRRPFVLYGTERLEAIRAGGETEQLRVLVIDLDDDTTELEWAVAAVRTLKGHDDYTAGNG